MQEKVLMFINGAAILFPVKILLKERILNMQISYSLHHLNTPKSKVIVKLIVNLKFRVKMLYIFIIQVFNLNLEVCDNVSIV